MLPVHTGTAGAPAAKLDGAPLDAAREQPAVFELTDIPKGEKGFLCYYKMSEHVAIIQHTFMGPNETISISCQPIHNLSNQ